MYTSELVVGARSREAVEQALRLALPSLGLAISGDADAGNVSELWERRGHVASVAVGAVGDGIFGLSVRGPRSPAWNNELARRLSQHLGGWAASCVSDRLLDEHGYGYFLDGLVIETAARNAARVVERAGFLREVPDRVIFDSLDEERCLRSFRAALERLAGPYVSTWPPSGAIRLLFVEGDGVTVSELVRPPSTLLVAAGHRERIDVPGYEYDAPGDGGDVRILIARTALPHWEIMERVDAAGGVALFTDGRETYVRRRDESASVRASLDGLRWALEAWEPVHVETFHAPMAFTFDAARATSPWR